MASTVFDRETLLDLLVNVIPLGILAFFIVLFLVDNPFGGNPIYTFLQFGIVVATLLSLLVLTYYSGRAVAEDEQRREGTTEEELPPGTVVPGEQAEGELPEEEGETGSDEEDDADESEAEEPDEDADEESAEEPPEEAV